MFSTELLVDGGGRQAQTTIINGTFMQKAVIANFQVIITDTSSYEFYFGF